MPATFTGRGRLQERPIGIYTDLLPRRGVSCRTAGGLPFSISGRLQPGVFELPGNVSSQFITGLLLALPLLPQASEIVLTTPLESAAYVEMTVQALAAFGVHVERTARGWHVPGGQRFCPGAHRVEGDWSQAAIFLAAGALGGDVRVHGLRRDSLQGDKAIESLLAQGGASLSWEADGALRCRAGNGAGFRSTRRRFRSRACAGRGLRAGGGRDANCARGAAAPQGERPAGRDGRRAAGARRARAGDGGRPTLR